jgi:hypothetical protein
LTCFLAWVPSRKPFLKRRLTSDKWRMRPVPVVFLRVAFSLQLSVQSVGSTENVINRLVFNVSLSTYHILHLITGMIRYFCSLSANDTLMLPLHNHLLHSFRNNCRGQKKVKKKGILVEKCQQLLCIFQGWWRNPNPAESTSVRNNVTCCKGPIVLLWKERKVADSTSLVGRDILFLALDHQQYFNVERGSPPCHAVSLPFWSP